MIIKFVYVDSVGRKITDYSNDTAVLPIPGIGEQVAVHFNAQVATLEVTGLPKHNVYPDLYIITIPARVVTVI